LQRSAAVLMNRLLARGRFRHLQVLLALVELGSLQRAAAAIGVTQSSVTQTLSYLEGMLELPLFVRHARGVHPTPACLDLVPVARQLVRGLSESAEVVSARQRRGSGTVRVLASASANNSLLDVLLAYCRARPKLVVHLREAENEDQLLAVARGEVDLVACRRPATVPERWMFHPVLADRLVVACGPNHPVLRKARRHDWNGLSGEHWLLAPSDSIARRHFDVVAARMRREPRVHPLVTRVLSVLLAALQQEDLLLMLPYGVIRPYVDAGELAVVPTKESIALESLGLMLPVQDPSPVAVDLVNAVCEAFGAGTPWPED